MKELELTIDPRVEPIFQRYPAIARNKLLALRRLILETAQETEEISALEETLKWGKPSYLTRHGSTIRIDWKAKSPDQYAVYFKCTSLLVPSFREVFPGIFTFEGNRAIIFQLEDEIPKEPLRACIRAALRYHKVKHLENLGLRD